MITEPFAPGVSTSRVQEGVASLLECGYFIIENALSPAQCNDAAALLDELIERGQAEQLGGFGYGIHPLLTRESRLADYYCEPLALAILSRLFDDGVHLTHSGARLSDASHTPRLDWHIHPYSAEENVLALGDTAVGAYPQRVICGWYLEGCTPESGPLVVLPRRYDAPLAPPSANIGEAWPGEVAVSCPPGSCVMFTTDLWHAALAGTNSRRRHLFGAHFQGRNNARPHCEDHIHQGPEIELAAARNPEFARLTGH